jgi:hypothetical protein
LPTYPNSCNCVTRDDLMVLAKDSSVLMLENVAWRQHQFSLIGQAQAAESDLLVHLSAPFMCA